MQTGAAKLLKGPRACVTCARSKSRCVPGPAGQDKCERCHRLVKPCSSQAPAAPRKRKEPRSRVAEIERRLEDLMARIESGQALAPAAPSPPDSEPRGAPTFSRAPWDPPFEQVSFPVHPVPPPPPPALPSAPYQHPSSSRPQQRQEQGCAWPRGDEAEALLDEYKTHLAHLFPFVVVPPHLSSAQLREQKPVLWKAVMLEACLFDGPRQIALGKKLLADVLDAAFIRPENSLDLLQGLQLLIAWHHYHLNNFQMANLLFLARSITISLGSAKLKDLSDKGGHDSDSLEQMRAFVGTYYLVTITFTTNKRPDALMSTSYLTTCCRALHSRMEYPTDELVVHLVRAQQLAQGVSQGCARRNAAPAEKQTPLVPFVQALRDRIQAFAASLPPHIRADPTLAGHLQVAEVLIYENSLEELACCPMCGVRAATTATAATAAQAAAADPERIELLRACVRVLQSFIAIRFSHEIGEYPRFICPSAFDLTYVFLTTLKLVILQVPGWDGRRAREELQFDGFVDRLLEMLERAAERRWKKRKEGVAGGDGKHGRVVAMSADGQAREEEQQEEEETEDVYAKLARKMRKVKEHLLAPGLDSDYTTSHMARVCDPPPMTLADATQDLIQDLGAGLWQDDMGAVPDWSPFLVSDAFDWTATFGPYAVPESAYAV